MSESESIIDRIAVAAHWPEHPEWVCDIWLHNPTAAAVRDMRAVKWVPDSVRYPKLVVIKEYRRDGSTRNVTIDRKRKGGKGPTVSVQTSSGGWLRNVRRRRPDSGTAGGP